MSLEQIILTQEDEPQQKNCIYKLVTSQPANTKRKRQAKREKSKIVQIRVHSIDYHDHESIAIYIYDVSHHFESFELE